MDLKVDFFITLTGLHPGPSQREAGTLTTRLLRLREIIEAKLPSDKKNNIFFSHPLYLVCAYILPNYEIRSIIGTESRWLSFSKILYAEFAAAMRSPW